MKPTTYFKGDKAEYTGNVLTIHGGTFYEVVMLEGFHKGQLKVVTNAPVSDRVLAICQMKGYTA